VRGRARPALGGAHGRALQPSPRQRVLIDLWYVTQTTKKVTAADLARLRNLLVSSPVFVLAPIDLEVVDATTSIPRDVLGDPWDRFIVATARTLGLSLVTRDSAISDSDLVLTIW